MEKVFSNGKSVVREKEKAFHSHPVRKKKKIECVEVTFSGFILVIKAFFLPFFFPPVIASFLGGRIFSMDFKLLFKEHLFCGYLLGSVT